MIPDHFRWNSSWSTTFLQDAIVFPKDSALIFERYLFDGAVYMRNGTGRFSFQL